VKKILLSFVAIFNCLSVEAINIKLLKGTHTIVPADYSPVMGLSFLEWGIAEQWYKLSARMQTAELKEVLDKNPEAVSDNPELAKFAQEMGKNSATENLIMSMFHIAGGTFNVTNADGNPVKYVEPEHIGKILQVVQKWKEASADPEKMAALKQEASLKKTDHEAKKSMLDKEIQVLNSQITKAKTAAKAAKGADVQVVKSNLQELQSELKLKDAELERHKTLSKKLVDPALRDFAGSSLQQELNDVCMSFKLKNGSSQQLFQEKDWKPFVSSLAGSIQETMGAHRLYAENTPEGILLGFMLKKSNTRQDLLDYFKGFLRDEKFLERKDEMAALLQKPEYSTEEISQILAAKTNASDFDQLADLLSVYTYHENYGSAFPKVTQNKGVDYKGISFQDCMDTTIRMLANIVTYKPSEGKVGVSPEGLSLNPSFKEFYGSENGLCGQSSEVGNSKVHQAWTQVIENVPGCSYNRIGDGQGNNFSSEVRNFCDGVIPVDVAPEGLPTHELEIDGKKYQLPIQKVGDRTYWLVPKNSGLVCAEMMPNASNVLVTMNHIFDLKLFDNQTDIFDPKFASTYFKQMCEKLGWEPQVSLEALDGKQSIEIPIKTKAGIFTIHLHDKAHGYVSIKDAAKLNINLEVPEATSQATVAAIVGTRLKKMDQLSQELRAACLYKDVSVLNIDRRYDAFSTILGSQTILTDAEESYVRSLIRSFCFVEDQTYLERLVIIFGSNLKEAGLGDFIVGALQLHDAKYKGKVLLMSLVKLIEHKLITVEQGLSLIEKEMSDPSDGVRSKAMLVIKSLIDNNLITVEKGLPLVKKGMSDSSDHVRSTVMAVIKSLIDNKLITVEQGLPLIEKGMSDLNQSVRSDAMSAIKSLIYNKLIAVDQVAQLLPLIEKGMSDSGQYDLSNAMSVITNLINNNLIKSDKVSQLLPLLKKVMNDLNQYVRSDVMSAINNLIYNKLITVGQVPQLLPLLEKAMIDSDVRIRSNAMSVIKSLIDKNLIISDQVSQLLPLIKKGMVDPDIDVRKDAVLVIINLINKDLITLDQVPQLLSLIEKRMVDSDSNVRNYAAAAIESLVDKKMITQSEVDRLTNLATDDSDKQRLEELKLYAPVSIAGKEVEAKIKTKVKLSKNQRREITERMKQQRQKEVQQEQLRQKEQLARQAEEQRQNTMQEHDFTSSAGPRL
jgi:hypothetical protein